MMAIKRGFLIVAAAAVAVSAFGAAPSLERDVEFILKYAPPQDMPLPGDYVTNNCLLAAVARDTAIESYPDDIYLDYVLPYNVIREGRDDWRDEFRERFLPLIADCTNAYDAAVKLDRTIWDMVGVHYDKRRDKARQSPRHSMRIGMASCTGISIILIDACRAVGIPARLVGCNWTMIPGNHSWVEVWSGGRWRVLASGEKEREDSIWFLDYALEADITRIDRRIYASRYSPSKDGTRFWLTWDFPQMVSDVPADDVTLAYVRKPRYAVVASKETLADPEWRKAAEMLASKHEKEAEVRIIESSAADAAAPLREWKPRYVAFLMKPDEFDNGAIVTLKGMMRSIDEDPFDDAIWGIVTGRDVETVQRIASSSSPRTISSILATTGVDANIVPGDVMVLSDAYPKGEWRHKNSLGMNESGSETNNMAGVFARGWRDIDPELMVTSSHATERNLEMPFSIGNIIATNGIFMATPRVHDAEGAVPLDAPRREKVWLAAGNCLIANHLDCFDMVMTALSFGKVNQFVGYIKPTWFGFAGWNTWRYFGSMGYSLAESHFAACQWLMVKLGTGNYEDETEKLGLLWDMDGTVFYGDPLVRTLVPNPEALSNRAVVGGAPALIIFPDSAVPHRLPPLPEGTRVMDADDFTLIFPQQ